MKKQVLLLLMLLVSATVSFAQGGDPTAQRDLVKGNGQLVQEDNFVVDINHMSTTTRKKLNQVAAEYRTRGRSAFTDIGKSMLYGGVSSVFTVVGNEIISLTKIRSQQKKKWNEMRQKECFFSDSLLSIKGQRDFYRKPSARGPLDPTDMNFDGITFRANRNGKEILKMVCHIDTFKLDHMFLHSKFYLVLDTLVFHPYQSYLPNLSANRIMGYKIENPGERNRPSGDGEMPGKQDVDRKKPTKGEKELVEYWNTISKFSFVDQNNPTVNIRIDLLSSWINEAVQVYQDVKLGSFSVNIPFKEEDLKDSVYFYSRQRALKEGKETIDMSGDCFVVPRSYMPVEATNPSWGTGEYKMKVVMSERCQYNPDKGRSTNWHKDYKQLVRLQNNGKARNEYVANVVSTFRDSKDNIIKATYTPLLNAGLSIFELNTAGGGKSGTPQGGGQGGGAEQGSPTNQMPQGGQNVPQKP